jgi:hypothetical protein
VSNKSIANLIKTAVTAAVAALNTGTVAGPTKAPKGKNVPNFGTLNIAVTGLKATGDTTTTDLRKYSGSVVVNGVKGKMNEAIVVKGAKFFVSPVYVPKGARASESITAAIELKTRLNKDGSAKHGRGGHSLKSEGKFVAQNGMKLYVKGYHPAA